VYCVYCYTLNLVHRERHESRSAGAKPTRYAGRNLILLSLHRALHHLLLTLNVGRATTTCTTIATASNPSTKRHTLHVNVSLHSLRCAGLCTRPARSRPCCPCCRSCRCCCRCCRRWAAQHLQQGGRGRARATEHHPRPARKWHGLDAARATAAALPIQQLQQARRWAAAAAASAAASARATTTTAAQPTQQLQQARRWAATAAASAAASAHDAARGIPAAAAAAAAAARRTARHGGIRYGAERRRHRIPRSLSCAATASAAAAASSSGVGRLRAVSTEQMRTVHHGDARRGQREDREKRALQPALAQRGESLWVGLAVAAVAGGRGGGRHGAHGAGAGFGAGLVALRGRRRAAEPREPRGAALAAAAQVGRRRRRVRETDDAQHAARQRRGGRTAVLRVHARLNVQVHAHHKAELQHLRLRPRLPARLRGRALPDVDAVHLRARAEREKEREEQSSVA